MDLFEFPEIRVTMRGLIMRRIQFIRLGCAVSLVLASCWAGAWTYENDFSGAIGPEWSSNSASTTPVGNRRFLGEFGRQSIVLLLTGLPSHSQATMNFDVFFIRTWDGNNDGAGGINGPDAFQTSVTGPGLLLNSTFSNVYYFGGFNQSYPNPAGLGNFAPFTGAEEVNTLGYFEPGGNPADSVYHFSFTFAHTAGTFEADFDSLQTELVANESWGLDNVRVTVVPEPVSGLAAGIWLALLASRAGLKRVF